MEAPAIAAQHVRLENPSVINYCIRGVCPSTSDGALSGRKSYHPVWTYTSTALVEFLLS